MARRTAAIAAAEIRKALKDAGIKASVRSSGGYSSSITIATTDASPDTLSAITEIYRPFKYGTFDPVQDLYEYTNVRDDIPQVEYIHVDNKCSPELEKVLWQIARRLFGGCDELPADFETARDMKVEDGAQQYNTAGTYVHRLFTGFYPQYWEYAGDSLDYVAWLTSYGQGRALSA